MGHSEMIMEYMKKNGSITQADAVREFGCYRLGARIYDLKANGVDVRTTMEEGENRYGAKTRYARYWIMDCTSRKADNPDG